MLVVFGTDWTNGYFGNFGLFANQCMAIYSLTFLVWYLYWSIYVAICNCRIIG